MRKTVVVLLTSLLLASLPAQADHTEGPGAAEPLTLVVHDCVDDYGPDNPGNDLSSVWVGTGIRSGDFDADDDTPDESLKVVLVTVVLSGRNALDARGTAARLSVQMETNNNALTTVMESPPDPQPGTSNPNAQGLTDDWQDADTLLYVDGESNLEPLGWAVREVDGTTGATPEPRGHRVLELWYRFADVFAPGDDPPPDDLVIEDKWNVRSSYADGDGFAAADVMPGPDDPDCVDPEHRDSPILVPAAPVVTGVTATLDGNPAENVDRRPDTKVRFRAQMNLGGGDAERDGYAYEWTFTNGDATIESTDAEPEVRFTELEPVHVTLKVTDDLDVESALYDSEDDEDVPDEGLVEFVNLDPVADFRIAGDEVPVVDDPITFTDLSFDPDEDDVTDWSWDFDDDSDPATTQNPSHTFKGVGVYDVTLTVTDEHGATDDHFIRITVCAEAGDAGCKVPNAAPQASFTADATQVTQGESITFTDTSTDRDGTIAAWTWNFGDGATSVEQDPTHTFTRVGTFQVTLTVTDDGGLVGTRAMAVRVLLPEPEEDDEEPDLLPAPIAAFTVEPKEPVVGEPVRFRDATTAQTDIDSWTWFFGDGSDAGDGAEVTHTYEETGTYTVRLTVMDDRGVRDTTARTIVVGSGETDEGAPGAPVVLLLAAVVLAAAAVRRRG